MKVKTLIFLGLSLAWACLLLFKFNTYLCLGGEMGIDPSQCPSPAAGIM